MNLDLQHLQQWIGRTESSEDEVTQAPIAALTATLDREELEPKRGDALPFLWHWLYFLPFQRTSELEADGLSRPNGLLPPIPLPRVMYAGNHQKRSQLLKVGDSIRRTSRIMDVRKKEGRSGPLVFVALRHEVSNDAGLAIEEDQELVYRGLSPSDAPAPKPIAAPLEADWKMQVVPGPALLFRFSALTFNAHRIHYDYKYTTETEGYPALVVHGRLIFVLLADLLRRHVPDENVQVFSARAIWPAFIGKPLSLYGKREADGKTVKLWAADQDGWLATEATATVG